MLEMSLSHRFYLRLEVNTAIPFVASLDLDSLFWQAIYTGN